MKFILSTLFPLCIFSNLHAKTIILAIGEHHEINLKGVQHYTNGNTEVLGIKKLPGRNTLLLKGKTQGFSEIFLNGQHLNNSTHQIFVIKKALRQKQESLKRRIERLNLSVKREGLNLHVHGMVKNLDTLKLLHDERNKSPYLHIQNVNIDKLSRNKHIGEIYRMFWKDGVKNVRCEYQNLKYHCYYFGRKLSKSILNNFNRNLSINLIELENKIPPRKCLFYSIIEKSDENFNEKELSPSKILISKKSKLFNLLPEEFKSTEGDSKLTLSAHKKIVLSPGHKAKLSTGVKVPIISRNTVNGNAISDWLFIGVETNVVLNIGEYGHQLKIENKISSPSENKSYSFNQTNSVFDIQLNLPVIFFHQKINQSAKTSKPIIPLPPFNLFTFLSGKIESTSKKEIIGIVEVKPSCSDQYF